MRVDRNTAKVVAIVLLWAVVARTAVLHWSPYPATLDGFFYVRSVEIVGATGHVPAPIDLDRVVMTGFLAVARAVLGVAPLDLLQPLSAVLGVGPVLAGIVLVRRTVGDAHGVSVGQARVGVALAGGVLAVEGLFVRRTGVPDEELLGLFFVPLVAYTFHRWLRTEQLQWGIATSIVLTVLPATHSLSTTVALGTLGTIAVVHTSAEWRGSVLIRSFGGVLIGGAWAGSYYWLALESPGVTVSYAGRLLASTRLLSAWMVLLAVGVVWFVRTSARIQRAIVGVLLMSWIGVLGVNLTAPVYSRTMPTPPLVLVLTLPLAGVVVTAALGIDRVADRSASGAAVLGLFVAPVVLVNYFLTAGGSPDLFGALLRVQTFAHLPVAVIAGILAATRFVGSTGVSESVRWRRWGRVSFAVVLLCAVVTAPLGVMALDTATIPGTTTPQAFAGTGFAATHVSGSWASDDQVRQISRLYYGASARLDPVAGWSRGGSAPERPVLATPAWTRRGVHQYPRPPARVSEGRFETWRTRGQMVYTTGGAGDRGHYFLLVPA